MSCTRVHVSGRIRAYLPPFAATFWIGLGELDWENCVAVTLVADAASVICLAWAKFFKAELPTAW